MFPYKVIIYRAVLVFGLLFSSITGARSAYADINNRMNFLGLNICLNFSAQNDPRTPSEYRHPEIKSSYILFDNKASYVFDYGFTVGRLELTEAVELKGNCPTIAAGVVTLSNNSNSEFCIRTTDEAHPIRISIYPRFEDNKKFTQSLSFIDGIANCGVGDHSLPADYVQGRGFYIGPEIKVRTQ